MVNPDTEIRKLAIGELNTLARYLSPDAWKILMASIKVPDSTSTPRFTAEDVRLIEEAGRNQQRPAAEVFLSEWCTMGKTKPTIGSMIELLIETNLLRAADYLAVDVLKGDPVERPQDGPAAKIDISRILEESTPPDSDNETNVEREAFWDGSTVPVDLEDIGMMKMDIVEDKIKNVEACFSLDLQAVSSDLIKFSKSVEQIQEERSDMIKFSSDVIADEKSRGNGHAVEEPYLIPSFSLLGLKTSQKSGDTSSSYYTETTCSVDSTEESTRTNSPQSDEDTRNFPMQSDDFNLPAMSQILPDALIPESSEIEIDPSVTSGDVEDVPLPVLEFFKR